MSRRIKAVLVGVLALLASSALWLPTAEGAVSLVSRYLGLSDGTVLAIGAVTDGQALVRSGTTITSSAVQQADTELTCLAGTTSAANKVPYYTGAGTCSTADFTSAGRALLDDADAAAQRTTLTAARAPVSSASAPTTGDDAGDGYAEGQVWVDTTADVPYVLVDATTSAAVWRSLLRPTSYEIRLTGGAWYAYPQAWTGSAWVDVGAGVAGTVEAGSGTAWSASGTTLTLLAGLTNTTQPHASQGKVYWTTSDLSAIWSSSVGAVYYLGTDAVQSMTGGGSDNGRIGIVSTFGAAPYDASNKTAACLRVGYNQTDTHRIATGLVGTGTFGSPILDSTTQITGARMVVEVGQAVAFGHAQGSANGSNTFSPPTTTVTRIYVIMSAANTTAANITLADQRFRVGRLTGSP